jgi:hypothetical protein
MLRYNISSGIKKIKTKTAIIVSVVTLGLGGATFGLALPFAAHASSVGNGSDYGTQPGFTQAQSQTQCSGAGAFGAFGKDYNLGNSVSGHYPGGSFPGPGADGQQTGANNSSLCGNPQN